MPSDQLSQLSLGIAGLIPAVLILATPFVRRKAPFRAASLATSAIVVLAVLAVSIHAFSSKAVYDADELRIGSSLDGLVELDLVSSAMLVLVCTLSLVVVRYSRTYLAGEDGLLRYSRSLLLTLAAVTSLVISNHLGLLVMAWLGTGIGLHQLLTFYPLRRQAIIVAHKEFLLSRLADLCFFASLLLVEAEVRSLHIDVVNAFAESHKTLPPQLHLATVLLVFGVLLKSAQLPFAGWMQQVMEAPTPVSALLHAGIVNIGGFVMIRLAPLMARATIAQGILIGVGLFTAIIGSLVMTTRVSVKLMLAWSTIAQMGFMLVQCGLGAWHLALLHLLAHSLYKAHSFLSAGSVVETWRGASLVRPTRPSLASMAAGAGAVGIIAIPLWIVSGFGGRHASPSLGPLVLALGLGFVPTLARAFAAGRGAFGRAALFCAGATVIYLAWHALFEALAPSINAGTQSPFAWSIVVVGLVLLFVAQTIVQTRPKSPLARLLQPHLFSGFYIDEWFTRLTFRLWPPRLERPATASRRSALSITREHR